MLGLIMNSFAGKGSTQLVKIPHSEKRSLEIGTLVIAVRAPGQLRENGLLAGLRFGITSDSNQVICQQCVCEDMDAPRFEIRKYPLDDFCDSGWILFSLQKIEGTSGGPEQWHHRATKELGTVYLDLRSYPGDDFVAECVYGETSYNRRQDDSSMGQHWWTPLYYTLSELQELVEDALNAKLPRIVPGEINPEMLHFIHHGITIEDGWVIHFASCRVPDNKNRVKLDTLETFCSITPYAEAGGPLPYRKEDVVQRLMARNRAVWILFHEKEWGKYNLIWNNCEHFSRMCKVGRRESRQVKLEIGKLVWTIGSIAAGGGVVPKLALAGLPYIMKHVLPNRLLISGAPVAFDQEN